MRIRFAAAAAVLLTAAAPAAAAEGDVTYKSVTHCAAFNLLLAQVYKAGAQAEAKKAEIETYSGQAAALMVVASTMSNASAEKVHGDVTTENDAMIKSLGGDGAIDKLLKDNMVNCTVMGQAAKETLDKMLAKQS
jgi:hypothetical protein